MIGRSKTHCKIYRRELRYFKLVSEDKIDESVENDRHANKTMSLTGRAEHYKEVYKIHNTEVKDFFQRNAPEALHVGRLEDPDKWKKLGSFLELEMPSEYSVHANRSEDR